jgi:ESS family glutamate:Na+ symporter
MSPTEPLIVFPNVVTIACGALTWLVGVFLVRKISFLGRYNFPAPVVGGIVVALVFTVLHERGVPLPKFDTQLINSLIIAFFASLGFGASWKSLRSGGRDVTKCLIICSLLLVVQVLIGISIAFLFGMHPLFGVMTSIVALAGGPGTALAFAPTFEQAGLSEAATYGLAAAMGGVLLGGLLGGPLGTMLVKGKHLAPENRTSAAGAAAEDKSDWLSPDDFAKELVWQCAYLLIIGSAGWYLSKGFSALGLKLPFYIGAMIIAAIVRNVDDATGIFRLNIKVIDAIGGACLTFFIATMMMTLELWSLAAVAGVLAVMLIVQAAFVAAASQTFIFTASGKDYDAAVMSVGLVGFLLGTTATALASMNSLVERYGPAPRAFLVVPLVGACFIDFVNALVISLCLNILT